MSTPFDLRQLRYFVAVAEELNFRRAAERLFISQPPLSRQVRELEKALGVRLFERDTTMVKLTSGGEVALRRARRLLADAEALALDLKRFAANTRGAVRIAATVAIPVAAHRRLAAEWKRVFGGANVEVEAGETRALMTRLRQREFEFALLGATADLSAYESEIVHTVPLHAVFAPGHPAAVRKTVALKDLAGTPFFWFPRNYNPGYFDQCAKVFAQSGFKPRYVLVQPGQLRTLERIAHGEGCTLLSASQTATGVKGLVRRKLREGEALGIRIAAVWQRESAERGRDKLGKQFAAVARRVLNAT